MFSTCLFCHRQLGANTVVEHFPVGRRLAFDAAKGRLWVACTACGRWNLTPLEERWEAIETCERLYRGTRLRAATDNVGLARLREGLELVRVGKPLRPELAAWRYGREFLKRRFRHLPEAALTSGAAIPGFLGASGIVSLWMAGAIGVAGVVGTIAYISRQARARVVLDGKRVLRLGAQQVNGASLIPDDAAGWQLVLRHAGGTSILHGDEGRRAAGILLARVNRAGARRGELEDAIAFLDRAGDADAYFARVARVVAAAGPPSLGALDREVAIALEMAAHDAAERRAMDGELAQLEREWRLAEEIATIADGELTALPATPHAAGER